MFAEHVRLSSLKLRNMAQNPAVLVERDINVASQVQAPEMLKTRQEESIRSAGAENENSICRAGSKSNSVSMRDSLSRQKNKAEATFWHRKNLRLLSTAVEAQTSSVSSGNEPTKKKKRHIEVNLTPILVPLADDSVPFKFDKDSGSKKVVANSAGPLCHFSEFDPHMHSDEAVLMNIFKYEFQKLDEITEVAPAHAENCCSEPLSWFNFDVLKRFYHTHRWLLDPYCLSWGVDMSYYLLKYPWDKFYDVELFHFDSQKKSHKESPKEDHGLNLDMIPSELEEVIVERHLQAKAGFRFTRKATDFVPSK